MRGSTLFITDAYSNKGKVFCSKLFSIYVIELQHGLITKNLPHSHYPFTRISLTIPDKILLYSKEWLNASKFASGQVLDFIMHDFLKGLMD